MLVLGLFYAGFGAIITPAFGVKAAFGDDTVMYNNAVGFFMIRMLHVLVVFTDCCSRYCSVDHFRPHLSRRFHPHELGLHRYFPFRRARVLDRSGQLLRSGGWTQCLFTCAPESWWGILLPGGIAWMVSHFSSVAKGCACGSAIG